MKHYDDVHMYGQESVRRETCAPLREVVRHERPSHMTLGISVGWSGDEVRHQHPMLNVEQRFHQPRSLSSWRFLTRVAGLGPSTAALHPCDLSPGAQLDLLVHLWLQKEKLQTFMGGKLQQKAADISRY